MQFSLQTLMLSFVVVAASLSLCGPWGLLLAAVDLACAGYIRMAKNRPQAWEQIFKISFLILFCLFIYLLMPGLTPKVNSRKMQCLNNQRQIALALYGYAGQHGHFPPAYIADENGKPMHSWRVLILRELDHSDLYDAYKFNEPWNGPNNSKLASAMPSIYQCPSHVNGKNPNCTNYVAVVGPNTMWPGEKARKPDEISAKDGEAETIFFMELPNSDINWMEPRDLSYDELVNQMTPEKKAKIFNAHPGCSVVTYVDTHSK